MKKIFRNLIFSFALFTISFFSFAQKRSINAFYKYEVECEGSEMDGSQMVRAFGNGKTKMDAKKQAEKIAVHAIIFKGIRLGESGCSVKPLVFNPNIEDEKADFFNEFFSDEGGYSKFISYSDTPKKNKIKERGEGKEKFIGVIVTVNVPKLKKELIEKGIIPKPE